MTLSKNMQTQFNNQPGKYILSVLGIGSTEPQKSLANGFFHIFGCVYQWSALSTFAKATVHFR